MSRPYHRPTEWRQCDGCTRSFAVRKDGKIRKHECVLPRPKKGHYIAPKGPRRVLGEQRLREGKRGAEIAREVGVTRQCVDTWRRKMDR